MANIGYMTTKQLREEGVNAELMMEKSPRSSADPLQIDPSLKNSYPSWIHFFDKQSSWKRIVLKKMRDKNYDLIHSYVEFPMLAYLSQKKFVAHPQGSDLRELAFSKSFKGYLLRKAYKKAKAVIVSAPEQIALLKKLRLPNGLVLPISPEFPFFKPMKTKKNDYEDKMTIFHPANLDWKGKGNNILIQGFMDFVKNNPYSILIIIERGIDTEKTHQLVKSLRIEKKVKFVKGPLNYNELKYYYSIADVVADQFIVGDIGGIGRETLCMGKPLLTYFKEDDYQKLYKELPPILNANSSKEITTKLGILTNEHKRREIGAKSREWIEKFSSFQNYCHKLKLIYYAIINEKSISQIRSEIANQEMLQ